jgi:hypothetical protein
VLPKLARKVVNAFGSTHMWTGFFTYETKQI